MKDYNHLIHRHRFAAWAAARAAQRGFARASVVCLVSALESSWLPDSLHAALASISTAAQFDALHSSTCRRLVETLCANCQNATYGRAAKLFAVYLKSMVVVGTESESALARHAHPPIDRVLLQAIATDQSLGKDLRQFCRSISWTRLDEARYFRLIAALRAENLDSPSFWMLERYWKLTDEE